MADRKYKEYELKDFISKKKNVLFITGYMGSGKSTLANSFGERFNAKVISLDRAFGFNNTAFHNQPKEDKKFLKDFLSACGYYTNYDEDYGSFTQKWHIDSDEDRCITIIKYVTKVASPSKRFIIEGIQLYTYTAIFEYLMNWPLVVLEISANIAKSSDKKRAKKRGVGLMALLIQRPYKNEYYARQEILFQNFIDRVEQRKGG